MFYKLVGIHRQSSGIMAEYCLPKCTSNVVYGIVASIGNRELLIFISLNKLAGVAACRVPGCFDVFIEVRGNVFPEPDRKSSPPILCLTTEVIKFLNYAFVPEALDDVKKELGVLLCHTIRCLAARRNARETESLHDTLILPKKGGIVEFSAHKSEERMAVIDGWHDYGERQRLT